MNLIKYLVFTYDKTNEGFPISPETLNSFPRRRSM